MPSTKAPQLKVLINGAGIAGLTLAYWLARTPLNACITSIEIRGGAVSIVEKMGLLPRVLALNTTEEGTRLVNTSSKILAEFGKGENSFTFEYKILRADLCGLFLDASKDTKNVNYVYGDYVIAVQQTDKAVDVTFSSGKKDNFDLVVGADGSASRIRSLILDEETQKESDTKHWYWYNAPKGLGLMTRPHRDGKTIDVYMCITTPAHGHRNPLVEKSMNDGLEKQKEILYTYFNDAGWQAKRILAGVNECDDFYMSRAAYFKLPTWTNNRAVLLGDAAHATFGVGTTLAVEGAYLLAGELGKIQRSDEIPAALKRYEDTFSNIQGIDENLPPGFPQLAFPQTAWGIKVRDLLAWTIWKSRAYKLIPNDRDNSDESKLPKYEWVTV
ncbi:hypothetical protein G6011_06859 [Alternaria panax]|uniref:FAD-binding domain-containing protein n=1 Tax=Alternaria panax TaxID=48097 RepID=A0AAD4F8X8_9PLEO|nr:hypothetical protein G6011_06859 [Alternaria panax]